MSIDNTFPGAKPSLIDVTSRAEMARLIDQSKLMHLALKGLLPKEVSLVPGMVVLDLACGPGEWASSLAHQHRDLTVIGIDGNKEVVAYARALARTQHLSNVGFQIMDITQPLDFEKETVDLIHGRFLVGALDKDTWPTLLGECQRILKPSGVMILTECEGVQTNSPALYQLQGYLFHTLYQQGRSFSLDGHSLGVASMFRTLLQEAGFLNLTTHPFVIDTSVDSALSSYVLKDMEVLYLLLKPSIVNQGLVDATTYDAVYEQMINETRIGGFVSVGFGFTVWGHKSEVLV